jgi:hypothetical protein
MLRCAAASVVKDRGDSQSGDPTIVPKITGDELEIIAECRCSDLRIGLSERYAPLNNSPRTIALVKCSLRGTVRSQARYAARG